MDKNSIQQMLDSYRQDILVVDEEYRIQFANQAFCQNNRSPMQDILGKPFYLTLLPQEDSAESDARQQPPPEAGMGAISQSGPPPGPKKKLTHDLANLLSPIYTYAEILEEELPADSPLMSYVNGIMKGIERARDFIKNLDPPRPSPGRGAHPAPPPGPPSTSAAPPGGERIMFVDDEILVGAAGKRMLEKAGYEVELFTAGHDALAAFKENPARYDLVITDMDMPKMTGDILAMSIMEIRPDVPVILCTGLNAMTTDKFHSIGLSHIINKPVTSSQLKEKINAALAKHRR